MAFRSLLAFLGIRAGTAGIWGAAFIRLVTILLGYFGYSSITFFSLIICLLLLGKRVLLPSSRTGGARNPPYGGGPSIPVGFKGPLPLDPRVKVQVEATLATHSKILLDIGNGHPVDNNLLLKLTLGHGAQAHNLGKLSDTQWEQFQVYTQEVIKNL